MKYLAEGLFISFLWGALGVVNKYVLNHLESSTVFVLSGTVYFLLLLGLWFYNKKTIDKDLKKITQFQIFCIVASAIFLTFLPNFLYYYFLKRTKASIITAIGYSAPVFTLILAHLVLNEKIKAISALGIILITLGICFVSYEE